MLCSLAPIFQSSSSILIRHYREVLLVGCRSGCSLGAGVRESRDPCVVAKRRNVVGFQHILERTDRLAKQAVSGSNDRFHGHRIPASDPSLYWGMLAL
ncbi:hypothetical protein Pmani_002242 [Petrolisthes manimaculis]|uniref:Uncharacterized protein n=1 Tax=Petrolisthes manimaculis TaxID=1843537 RepID=A0AAE1QIC9_9EUCA|nr:hypothetical protein Pmani_002242 [Petrolisthes manimaculis]